MVDDRFRYVRIRGQISGFKRAASGHVYLALKDDKAVIDWVMCNGNGGRLPFQPEDGIEVVLSGKLTTYPGHSKYLVVIDNMYLDRAERADGPVRQPHGQAARRGPV